MLKRFLFTFSIVASIIIIFSVIVTQKREERRAFEANQKELTEKVVSLRKMNESLKKENKALVDDPIQIEREARDNYGYTREGEVAYKKYGLEYQGEQHYRPVDFFDGEKGFIKRKKLDSLKKRRCKKAKINLIEFKHSEPINLFAVINKLKQNGIKLKGGKYVQNI